MYIILPLLQRLYKYFLPLLQEMLIYIKWWKEKDSLNRTLSPQVAFLKNVNKIFTTKTPFTKNFYNKSV